jgi:hypothetical protein
LDVPVIVVNSAAEALAHFSARQPDRDVYRLWEIAGSAHTNAFWAPQIFEMMLRYFGMPTPQCEGFFNAVPNQYVMNTAVSHLVRWVRGESLPPRFPPIDISGSPPTLAHDEFGNPGAGVRLPEFTVPIARYEAGGDRRCPAGSGYTHPFSPEQLVELYSAHKDYVSKYIAAAEAAVAKASCRRRTLSRPFKRRRPRDSALSSARGTNTLNSPPNWGIPDLAAAKLTLL